MGTASEMRRESRREPPPFGWVWLRRLLGQRAAPVKPVLNLSQLRRIAYL